MPDGYKPLLIYALATSDAARMLFVNCDEMAKEGHILLPTYIFQKTNGPSFLLMYGPEATVYLMKGWLR